MGSRQVFKIFNDKMRLLKRETGALYFAVRHEETPIYAKILGSVVIGYAFCPIDLIPDFIPILGYLDDMILLPLGIALVIRLIPEHVMVQSRKASEEFLDEDKGSHWFAGLVIVMIWIGLVFSAVRHFI